MDLHSFLEILKLAIENVGEATSERALVPCSTLECHEACGEQGLKTENHVGSLISEFDISKTLLGEYMAVLSSKRPYKGLGLEHMNGPCPVILDNLTSYVLRSSKFQGGGFEKEGAE
ncbi:putative acyl-coenzyme A oxidase 3.2, peroxisomal [Acorus calamus]|uniref:Acyl-coenzyme A oxidase 3.2, peroxisomal n=1 Tax=Acorus calamus TaxID=4465 RepID=A0AAV9DCC6_ACOCL|nr:putative acyl-coenzyme A oxidase 3.2, peroxisomal [Acorus calamus]